MSRPLSASIVTTGLVEVRIPSKAEWVAVARLAVAAIASRLPFSVEEIEDLKLAVAEACTTAIQQDGGDVIEILCEVSDDELRLTVRDRGDRKATNVQVEENLDGLEGRGGLGVFLIRSLMDEVEYSSDVANGTNLVMIKKVSR